LTHYGASWLEQWESQNRSRAVIWLGVRSSIARGQAQPAKSVMITISTAKDRNSERIGPPRLTLTTRIVLVSTPG